VSRLQSFYPLSINVNVLSCHRLFIVFTSLTLLISQMLPHLFPALKQHLEKGLFKTRDVNHYKTTPEKTVHRSVRTETVPRFDKCLFDHKNGVESNLCVVECPCAMHSEGTVN
jgi:hypothetical protein